MPFVPAPGVLQIVAKGTWNGVIDVNTVLHVAKVSPVGGDFSDIVDVQNACQRMESALPQLAAQLPNDVTWNTLMARALHVEAGLVWEEPCSVTGVSTAVPTGALIGPIIQWRTGLAGRTNGRTFLPGTAEGNIDDNGQVVSTFRTACETAATAFRNWLTAAVDGTHPGLPISLVIVPARPEPGQGFRSFRQIVSNRVPTRPGIQRRRQIG